MEHLATFFGSEETTEIFEDYCLFGCTFKSGFVAKVFLAFFPCAIVSGVLYARVLFTLREGNQNSAKTWLSRCLCGLWLSWVLLNLPSVLFEIRLQVLPDYELRYNQYWNAYTVYWYTVLDNLVSSFNPENISSQPQKAA